MSEEDKEKDKDISELFQAARRGDANAIELLLQKGTNPNSTEVRGLTPLRAASVNGHIEATKVLLEGGADPNLADANGATPLSWAWFYRMEITKLLLEAGADPNLTQVSGETPLYWTVWRGSVELAKNLLEAGADPSLANKGGKTPLNRAEEMGHADMIDLLSRWPKVVPLRTLCLRAAKRTREVDVPLWVPPVLLEHLPLEEVLNPAKKQK